MSLKVEIGQLAFIHRSIPDGWTKARIGDICEIVRGVSYKKNQASEQPAEGKVPILRATNVQNEDLVLDRDLVYVPSELVSDIQKLRVGDIVVATSSGSKHLVGKTAQVLGAWKGSFGAFCAVIRPNTDIDHRYLGYFFNSRQYKDYISAKSLGVNINNLRRGDLEEISVPVAPKVQQRRIVAEIEKQFSRLDEAVANLKRVKANLKRYKAAVLKAAVEGKLTEDWRKQHPDIEPASKLLERILTERCAKWNGRGKYKEPAGPKTSGLPSLPGGWTWASPEQVSSTDAYSLAIGPFGSNLKVSDYRESGVPLIFVRNIRALNFGEEGRVYVSNAKAGELRAHRVSGGDILVTKMGDPPGDACLYPDNAPDAIITADCIKLRLSRLLPERRFIAHAINSEIVKGQIVAITKGVAQMKVSLARFSGIGIPLPPIAEQEQIVAEVERRLSVIEELEAAVEANLTRADRLRQSILQKAFNGELIMQFNRTKVAAS